MRRPAILVVDDEQNNIRLLHDILSLSYEVKVAMHGKQALKHLEHFEIDLVLLDIEMPGMNGYEVAMQIRANAKKSDLPIIFLSSKTDEASIIKGFDAGANDYVTKPFSGRELEMRVSNQINGYFLKKRVLKQENFLSFLLDSQPTMIMVISGNETEFVNKTLLDFFSCDSLETFKSRHISIANSFIENKNFFNVGLLDVDEEWIDAVMKLPPENRVVSMVSHQSFEEKAFSISVKVFEEYTIITFYDITQTMLKQLSMQEESERDPLTQAYNRTFFYHNIETVLQRFISEELQVALAIMDIDHFKSVNDTHGHDVGDVALVELIKVVKDTLRTGDLLIRWGGEEFLVIMPVKSTDSVFHILDKLREKIASHPFPDPIKHITCSIGATAFRVSEDIQDTIKRADVAMYNAKHSGRNKVVFNDL